MLNFFIKYTRYILLFLLGTLLFQFGESGTFKIVPSKPFNGSILINPYQNINLKNSYVASFHGHTKAWGGIVNGKGDEIIARRRYDSLGYDISLQSQYQNTGVKFQPIPVYEHGINATKTHQLVIGSYNVVWKDYFFPQTLYQKQYILNTLAKDSLNFIVINHPKIRNSYTANDLKFLQNYDAIELLRPRQIATDLWDTALSYGHVVSAIGSDDYHNIFDDSQIGNNLTMIFGEIGLNRPLVEALKKRTTCAVNLNQNNSSNLKDRSIKIKRVKYILDRIFQTQQTIELSLLENANIIWVSNQGIVKKSINKKEDSYRFSNKDSFIRIEVHTNDSIKIYLNPIYRSKENKYVTRQQVAKAHIIENRLQYSSILQSGLSILLILLSITGIITAKKKNS